MKTRPAVLGFLLVLALAVPAGANHYPNHTCGLFPWDGNARTSGIGFGTPEVGGVGATDHVAVSLDCLSLDTHESFIAYLEITFQWFQRGGWVDGPSVRCSARSTGAGRLEALTIISPTGCPGSHTYRPGDPVVSLPHRARLHVTTNVRNGPDLLRYTSSWTRPSTRGRGPGAA